MEEIMSKKHKGNPVPVPQANQTSAGPQNQPSAAPQKRVLPAKSSCARGAPASAQDPKRRLGNFQTAGEHAIEQPDGKQGAN